MMELNITATPTATATGAEKEAVKGKTPAATAPLDHHRCALFEVRVQQQILYLSAREKLQKVILRARFGMFMLVQTVSFLRDVVGRAFRDNQIPESCKSLDEILQSWRDA
jgi:hypothetical protein